MLGIKDANDTLIPPLIGFGIHVKELYGKRQASKAPVKPTLVFVQLRTRGMRDQGKYASSKLPDPTFFQL